MPEIPPELRAQLAQLSDTEWSTLTAQVRAPDGTEALRTAAAQLLSGDALDAYTSGADVSKFVGADGQVDANRVLGNIRAAFGITGQQQQANQGQHSGGMAPQLRPGDRGRLAANARWGTKVDPETAAAAGTTARRGAAGRAAAVRRFNQKEQQ
jgi:hypothetical protein